MGLPDVQQQEVYTHYWKRIEDSLDAKYETGRIDTFLRDFLRWKSGGILRGIKYVYEDMRRWVIQNANDKDRPALCAQLAEMAALYGVLTGANGRHRNKAVERELLH